jgi:hypothetical protein
MYSLTCPRCGSGFHDSVMAGALPLVDIDGEPGMDTATTTVPLTLSMAAFSLAAHCGGCFLFGPVRSECLL